MPAYYYAYCVTVEEPVALNALRILNPPIKAPVE
jgi:hypothetical protein